MGSTILMHEEGRTRCGGSLSLYELFTKSPLTISVSFRLIGLVGLYVKFNKRQSELSRDGSTTKHTHRQE